MSQKNTPQHAFEAFLKSRNTNLISHTISSALLSAENENILIAEQEYKKALHNPKSSQKLLSIIRKRLDLGHEKLNTSSTRTSLPDISVIIPYHNRENAITECIQSVLNQKISNIEIIAVDDGSTDSSREIVSSIKDSRLIMVNCHKASGNSGTPRNIALNIARGNYIAFVDSDDTIDKEYLQELFNEASRNNANITLSKRFNKKTPNKDFKINYIFKENFTKNDSDTFFFSNSFVIWDKLYKRDFLIKNNIYLADSKIGADTLMVAKTYYYARNTACICNNTSNYNYNAFSEGSVSKAYRSKGDVIEEDKPYIEIFKWMEREKIPAAYGIIQWIRRLMSLCYCLKSCNYNITDESKKYLNDILSKDVPFKSALKVLKSNKLDEQYNNLVELEKKKSDFC